MSTAYVSVVSTSFPLTFNKTINFRFNRLPQPVLRDPVEIPHFVLVCDVYL